MILAYQHALTPVFRYMLQVFALGFVFAFLLPEKNLSDAYGTEPDETTRPEGGSGPTDTAG
ncbi:hypothetical protein ABZS88_01830 [Streptomyces sp. NPDC005480]|uniref:hypothetical protein n=1 Tax=Streptomyces sp. NPDC005480 TaxID=3154880 RepID=UPI0033B80144